MPSHTHVNEVMMELTPKLKAKKQPSAPPASSEEDNIQKSPEAEKLLTKSETGEISPCQSEQSLTEKDYNYIESLSLKQSNMHKMEHRPRSSSGHRRHRIKSGHFEKESNLGSQLDLETSPDNGISEIEAPHITITEH